jgi:hypothetical protein
VRKKRESRTNDVGSLGECKGPQKRRGKEVKDAWVKKKKGKGEEMRRGEGMVFVTFKELKKMTVIEKNHVGALEKHLGVFESLKC